MEREGGRRRELLPLGGCSSRPGQRRLILVSVHRPAELAPGTVEIQWLTHPAALRGVHINPGALILQCIHTYTHISKCLAH